MNKIVNRNYWKGAVYLSSEIEPIYIFSTFRNGISSIVFVVITVAVWSLLGYLGGGFIEFITQPFVLFFLVIFAFIAAYGVKNMIKPNRLEFYEDMAKINGVDYSYSEMSMNDLIKPGFYFNQWYKIRINVKTKNRKQLEQNLMTEYDSNRVKTKRYVFPNTGIRKLGGLSLYTWLSQRVPHSDEGKSAFDEI